MARKKSDEVYSVEFNSPGWFVKMTESAGRERREKYWTGNKFVFDRGQRKVYKYKYIAEIALGEWIKQGR